MKITLLQGLVAITLILGGAGMVGWRLEIERNKPFRLNDQARTEIERGALAKAEEIIDELRRLGFGASPATLRTQGRLGLAYSDVDRLEDAADLLQKTYEMERVVLGEKHVDTCQTAESLKGLAKASGSRAWQLVWSAGRPQADYTRALALVRLAMKLDPSLDYPWMTLALVQYRSGDCEASLNSLKKSLESGRPWPNPEDWLLLAMVHQRLGHEELARDWFTASREWISYADAEWGSVPELRNEAASLLGLPVDNSPDDYVRFYSGMIKRHPGVATLWYRRGIHFGHRQKWKEAARDCARAVELQPSNFWAWESWGVVCLEMRDDQGYETVCRKMLTRFGDSESSAVRMLVVIVCCVGPSKNIHPDELDRIADDAFSAQPRDHWHRLGKGIAAYRGGRYEEAVNMLPSGKVKFPAKSGLLALLFRAMAHQQLGNADRARQLLADAREQTQKLVPGPGGPPVDANDDRPVAWCLVQAALRQAAALIEPAGQQPESERD